MNEKYVIDAYAWVEYLIGSDAGDKVRKVLEGGDCEIYTCTVTIAEVISKTIREGRNPKTAYEILISDSTIIDANHKLSRKAGALRAETRRRIRDFGLADAYVLASARNVGARVLTGDPHFRGFEEAVLITQLK